QQSPNRSANCWYSTRAKLASPSASVCRSMPTSKWDVIGLAHHLSRPPRSRSRPRSNRRRSLSMRRGIKMISDVLTAYAQSLHSDAQSRTFTVGASDIGQCSRKIFFVKHNGERNPGYVDTWGATLRGSIMEQAFWVPALLVRFGANLKFVGDHQRQFKRGFISATPDALLINAPRDILLSLGVADIGSDCLLLECKSVDPRVKLDAPKSEHRYQAIVQIGVVRDTTEYRPNFVLLTYIDASFWDTITEFVVAFDPEVYANAKTRAVQIINARL